MFSFSMPPMPRMMILKLIELDSVEEEIEFKDKLRKTFKNLKTHSMEHRNH